MAVSPLELRPRSSVELLDAALRLGGRSSGAWLLTLPGSLGLCAGLIVMLEALDKGGSLHTAAWLLGLAWCLRALGQGAACHHLEQRLLGSEPALLGTSVRAALGRAPTLLFTATVLGPITFVWGLCTLGFGLFFWASPLVAYAAAMHRRGPLLRLWQEAGNSLGASRELAIRVRWLLPFQALLLINLHVAVQFGLRLARSLFGLDVAQLSRMAMPDNAGWWMVLLVLTFAVMEPIRAATAVLLLMDGRVRRDGMDLHARLAALPTRGTIGAAIPRPQSGLAGKVALVVGLVALPFSAHAQAPAEPAPRSQLGRLDALVRRCTGEGLDPQELETLRTWTQAGSLTLNRWVERKEREAVTHGCERAMHSLSRDVAALPPAARPAPPSDDASEAARAILSRSEFELLPPSEAEGGVASFLEWLSRALETWLESDEAPREREREPKAPWSPGSGLGLSRLLLWTLPLVALVLALWVLGRHVRGRRETGHVSSAAPASAPPEEAPASALSQPPETWLRIADGLAAEGQLREAIRSAYLATLAGLHHQGRIRYDPNHSNWDHLMGFRGDAGARSIFRELTLRFDIAWYGAGDVDAATWQRVREQTLRLIGRDLVLEAAGA